MILNDKKFFIPLIFLLFISLTLLIYLNTFYYGMSNFDDHVYIRYLENIFKNGITESSLSSIIMDNVNANWHPITILSLSIDYIIGGNNPIYYHITNSLIHAVNAFLVFCVFRQISNDSITSLITAILFIIHPMNVESVIWISERKGLLSTLFALLSIFCYVQYKINSKLIFKVFSVTTFALSLLSKPTTATIPFVLILMELTIYSDRKFADYNFESYKKLFFNVLPYFVVLTVIIIYSFIAQYETGALRDITTVSISERLVTSINNIFTYISKIFIPVNLASYYPRSEVPYYIVLIYLIFVTSWIFVGLKFFSKSKMFVFCLFFFFVQIFPMSGIFQTGSHGIANRYTYLPSIGLFFIVGSILVNYKNKKIGYGFMLIIFFLLTFASIEQTKVWRTNLNMWENNAKVTESNYVSAYYYSKLLVESGKADEAFTFFYNTIGTKNDFYGGRMVSNMATVFIKHDDLRAARKILVKGINNKLQDSGLHRQIALLDYFYFNLKDVGLKYILFALNQYPKDFYVNRVYAKILFDQKKYNEALNILNKMKTIKPTKEDDGEEFKILIKKDTDLILKAMS